jgi:dGTPase
METVTANLTKFPTLMRYFREWIIKYSNIAPEERQKELFDNEIIYNLSDHRDYKRAIIDYIAGMTDNFAIRVYHEIISF